MSFESEYEHLVSLFDELNRRVELLEEKAEIAQKEKLPTFFFEPKEAPAVLHRVDLNDYTNKFSDMMWKMVEVIGKEGASRYPDIERSVSKQMPNFIETQLRTASAKLTAMNVLGRKDLGLPLTPRVTLFFFKDIGERLFRKQFKISPVASEMARVIKEHDNVEHGYGIMELGQFLANSGPYKAVHTFNRGNAVKFLDGTQYIPDLICLPREDGPREFYEYERGLHTQKDFNTKCNKMCKATQTLNFVAPNKDIIKRRLYPQVKEWIKSRGQMGIASKIIRITTPKELQKCSLSEESWLIVWDMKQSEKPVVCKMKVNED